MGAGGGGQGVGDAQQAGDAGGALTDEDGGAVGPQGLDELGVGPAEVGDDAGLLTGRGEDGLGGELAAAGAQAGGHGGHLDAAGAHALAQAQEHRAALVLGLQAQEQDLPGPLQVAVGDGAQSGAGHAGGQEGVLLLAVGAHALVDVVGAQDGAGEAGPGPGVLQGEAAAGQEPHSPV